jgi:uncharacterized protein (UPF0333 family)
MNTLEDRIRAAVAQTAEEIGPGSIRPLSLRGQVPSGRRTRAGCVAKAGRGSARWPRVLIPIAAAASVIAVVAASLAITGSLSGGRSAAARAHAGQPGTGRSHAGKAPQIVSAASRAALASVPEFYVALNPGDVGMNNRAQVRATATGAVLATVAAPAPYNTFSWVTAAADDRTFVLAAQEWTRIPPGSAGGAIEKRDDDTPTRFFVLHLSSDGRTARLSALPIPVQPGSVWIDGIALSPGGSKLAVVIKPTGANPDTSPAIAVYTVATGAKTEWVWPGSAAFIGNQKPWGSPLSWTADGRTLAFQIVPANGTIEVRLLDTDAPGGLKASRLGVEWTGGGVTGADGVVIRGSRTSPANSLFGYNTLITPGGTKIVCLTRGTTVSGVTEFDAATARVASNTYPQATDVLWTNASGSTLIVSNASTVGVLTGGQFTPLPDASNVGIMSAW